MNLFEYNFKSLQGLPMSMDRFRNQPVLIANTASECGYTPQYAKLQQLHNDYGQSGLVVIGIPSNDFGEQEPGDEEQIAEFCSANYGVTFPMTAKYPVTGIGAHPLFRDLSQEFGPDITPRWNFHKYLFDRKGQLVEHWPSKVEPDDEAVTHVITRNLQSWTL